MLVDHIGKMQITGPVVVTVDITKLGAAAKRGLLFREGISTWTGQGGVSRKGFS